MEVSELRPFVLMLVLVGILLGAGVLIVDKFSTAVLNDASTTEGNVRLWAPNYTTLSNAYITTTSVSAINATNATRIVTPLLLEYDYNGKWAGDGSAIRVRLASGSSGNGTLFNLTYTYGVDSATTDALQASRGEISGIATSWLGIIVTVAILALILVLVIRSFGGNTR